MALQRQSPPLVQTFIFDAGISRAAPDAAMARALIAILRTPDSRAVIVAKGMRTPP